ncbi:hypothetical protein AMATHDRAFT_46494 [Amanita thiersii Skay4041]|uniref:Uncharacterized protein n=1 Tax=Amanita thiersii Skay4041 TaxID=703135 RepID=A0A2A9NWP5_9AGAR|nr:hypothetical protein AMATHDRAFT_46494 [Amanita thiersii Skay4041]
MSEAAEVSEGSATPESQVTSEAAPQRRMRPKEVVNYPPDSALIRTMVFPESMKDALAIIRAVEQKYGPVREFQFPRDYENQSKYQSFIRVAFRNSASRDKIPVSSEEIQVVLPPPVPVDQQGGVGLDDLTEFLDAGVDVLNPPPLSKNSPVPTLNDTMVSAVEETQAKEEETEKQERVITCQVMRASMFQPPSTLVVTQFCLDYPLFTLSHENFFWRRQHRDAVARNLLNWGGFYEFPPLDSATKITEGDLWKPNESIGHIRMRHCLRIASKYLDQPNPYEYSPIPSDDPNRSQPVWEPLTDSADKRDLNPEDIVLGEPIQRLPKSADTMNEFEAKFASPSNNTTSSTDPSPTTRPPATPAATNAHTTTSSTAFHEIEFNTKELNTQLQAARSLARRVNEEQRKIARSRQRTSLHRAPPQVTQVPVLEQERKVESIPESTPGPESELAKNDSPQTQNKGVLGKFKSAWGGLF